MLQLLKSSQMQHGLRFGDYTRYRYAVYIYLYMCMFACMYVYMNVIYLRSYDARAYACGRSTLRRNLALRCGDWQREDEI